MLKIAVPILGVTNSAVSEKFYCGQLGFRRAYAHRPDPAKHDPCYMGVVRDGAHIVLSSFAGMDHPVPGMCRSTWRTPPRSDKNSLTRACRGSERSWTRTGGI